MFDLVGMALASAGGLSIAQPISVLTSAIQSAGGGFVALKCCWLGAQWRRGTEHGHDEFTALGISAALLVGSVPLGAAIGGGAAGMPLVPLVAGMAPWNEIVGDLVGYGGGLSVLFGPGLYLMRDRLHGFLGALRPLVRWGR